MPSAQGKVNSPLQCPGHRQGSELEVTGTFQFQEPTQAGFLKESITVCCLRQRGTVVTINKVLHKLYIRTEKNPLGINKKGGKVLPTSFSAAGCFQDLLILSLSSLETQSLPPVGP